MIFFKEQVPDINFHLKAEKFPKKIILHHKRVWEKHFPPKNWEISWFMVWFVTTYLYQLLEALLASEMFSHFLGKGHPKICSNF